jgi:hypothetical protein
MVLVNQFGVGAFFPLTTHIKDESWKPSNTQEFTLAGFSRDGEVKHAGGLHRTQTRDRNPDDQEGLHLEIIFRVWGILTPFIISVFSLDQLSGISSRKGV